MIAHIKNIDMNNIVWLIRLKYLKKYWYEYEKVNNFSLDINGSFIFLYILNIFMHYYEVLYIINLQNLK